MWLKQRKSGLEGLKEIISEQILDQNKFWNDVPSFSFTSRLIHDYLSMAPFADYLDSMYFNRFLQWKWLERWSLSHDTLQHNKTVAISTSSTFQREPDESRLLLITVNSQDHTKPPGASGKQDAPPLLGFIASSLLYSCFVKNRVLIISIASCHVTQWLQTPQ